ncbi:hypothetical protein C7T94_07685 [Pedobacter yulinensis]|uniref:Polysaccharide lyase 14 domain-containing protein n=1 Tax=Pedobacter yulinensis TaxID=2126353 RepID=A0A2T3HJC8_9SPHI|nr:hypothetical protein [Pedobacter yulinensis]PST82544.1 hypothetical protein C7T94_07685 [Pedobacter yulinensis]
MKTSNKQSGWCLGAVLILALISAGCRKQESQQMAAAPAGNEKNTGSTAQVWPSYINTGFTHPDGTFTYSEASSDFGGATLQGWNEGRAWISGNWARATLAPNSVSNGLISQVDISDGSAYEADFKIRFHSDFDWSRGGKVGFGFLIGEGNTGCDVPTDGNGGSLRLMWYNTGSRVFFQPYVYHRDMAGPCGDTFNKSYPASGSLAKGTAYNVHLYVKSNTGSNKDGWVQVRINGVTVLDQSIRWTTNNSQRLINRLSFHNFRGGKDVAVWGSSQTSYIYFDDLVVNKVSS